MNIILYYLYGFTLHAFPSSKHINLQKFHLISVIIWLLCNFCENRDYICLNSKFISAFKHINVKNVTHEHKQKHKHKKYVICDHEHHYYEDFEIFMNALKPFFKIWFKLKLIYIWIHGNNIKYKKIIKYKIDCI